MEKAAKKQIIEWEIFKKKNTTSGTFKDKRDGQTYKWVRLKDGKKWMAQNLNYEMADSWCYDNEESNCAKYGRLYYWDEAMIACPKGWRLPTDDEWWTMSSYYGKAWNKRNGQEINKGDDAGKLAYGALVEGANSGFNIKLGGYGCSENGFWGETSSLFWSSTESSASGAKYYCFNGNNKDLARGSAVKPRGFSCRCLQDE